MTKAFDRASDLEMEEREQALNRHLNRVKELPDEHGICNDCGAAIPAARLKALPYVATCVSCQSIRDIRGKHGLGNY
ncbi:TPA: TraR/DksA family transcriptional regulator [Klebsiella pneumoniae]|uniref:TraR/DksA family transcriptional regulator n=1 Tax=Klebsiella TaxID=570 RepID=UPI0007CC6D18|nr:MULTISPECIES: TraR/DksA family transcriptional regulator [Klebsiella]HBR2612602.1 TraR/DksA family transcriptional regulator [Klebsiella pneumoniae]SBL55983.1 TraR/DksA family transcriptional regulator [Klebsiella oxytoca]HCA9956358.1 TraR/DksA family transcriptional regulator [Klebsiella pneumoniae]HDY8572546.1 TraR/DksA family transcriptional regulator [Klebsiella pneumoniae]HEE4850500.1 TraR/DksA family transcriptional regulator [Klebsiella pneumoniae]